MNSNCSTIVFVLFFYYKKRIFSKQHFWMSYPTLQNVSLTVIFLISPKSTIESDFGSKFGSKSHPCHCSEIYNRNVSWTRRKLNSEPASPFGYATAFISIYTYETDVGYGIFVMWTIKHVFFLNLFKFIVRLHGVLCCALYACYICFYASFLSP